MTPSCCLHVTRPARNTRSAYRYAAASLAALAAALGAPAVRADAPVDALGDAIAGGKANLELRYRYENVDQDGFADQANASTLRTRLRYSTAEWESMTALVELDNVSLLGDEHFNDTRNGEVAYPLVVDPHGSDLNQALVKYVGASNTVFTVGRQRVNLDNQRFVGSVGWRQNEQTLDAALVEYKGIDRLTATYGFVGRVNRIYGPQGGTGAYLSEFDGETHLVNLKYVAGEKLSAVAYGYLLDFDNAAAGLSTQTFGLRLAGKVPVSTYKFGYTAEYAQQSAYRDNPASFDAPYELVELTFGGASGTTTWEAQAGYELLGEDAGVAVQTPLATLHKFQGWADKFLVTPAVGLADTYAGGTLTVQGIGFTVVAHRYEGDANGADYGSEVDAQVGKTFLKRYTLALKYADYSQGDVASVKDTAKAWVTAEAKF